ncbi:histidine triad nucleotide-binding protein [Coriobacteriia bacterium Es71-Z0120]|uniref:histidine triad nucleotide-binding protein n=1 Tax=Parvivirga hydrogeniphila TaxID=2939460 RepID=UPI0022609270|nr:histidine triad nucleotide-binding protein [Parvivirga hydrogeniphila]MCL4078918.1 histidine triad nucleotide-binding protein [Parvivirga hydrogeniphila]
MSECVFCMIARGEIPAKVVYSDEHVIAFDDIAPQAPVHTLIIPKVHYDRMGPDVPSEVTCALFAAVPKVAEAKGVAESGYRVIVNNGPDAMQTVEHLHVHVIGGRRMSHGMVNFG